MVERETRPLSFLSPWYWVLEMIQKGKADDLQQNPSNLLGDEIFNDDYDDDDHHDSNGEEESNTQSLEQTKIKSPPGTTSLDRNKS
ncbi:hypothetical protein SCA6_014497 [Theobroma cacao]